MIHTIQRRALGVCGLLAAVAAAASLALCERDGGSAAPTAASAATPGRSPTPRRETSRSPARPEAARARVTARPAASHARRPERPRQRQTAPSRPRRRPPPAPVTAAHRRCRTAGDCVPVTCRCGCSGCGGFAFQDVVNRRYERWWYRTRGCTRGGCYRRCCPPRRLVCRRGLCTVLPGHR